MPLSTVHSVGLCGVVAVWRYMLLHVEVSELCMPSQHLYLCVSMTGVNRVKASFLLEKAKNM